MLEYLLIKKTLIINALIVNSSSKETKKNEHGKLLVQIISLNKVRKMRI